MDEFDKLLRHFISAWLASRDESLPPGARCAAWVRCEYAAWKLRRHWRQMANEIARDLPGGEDDRG